MIRSRLFLPSHPDGRITYLVCMAGEGEKIWSMLQESNGMTLCEIAVDSWFDDLSPWPQPRLFRNGSAFGGKAADTLQELVSQLPALEAPFAVLPVRRLLCGYSLAGLFALWAGTQTDLFPLLGSFSGSLWYPDALPLLTEQLTAHPPRAVALSLGDREKITRSAVMATVEDNTLALRDVLAKIQVPVSFTLHSGGHFVDGEKRTVHGICEAWSLIS